MTSLKSSSKKIKKNGLHGDDEGTGWMERMEAVVLCLYGSAHLNMFFTSACILRGKKSESTSKNTVSRIDCCDLSCVVPSPPSAFFFLCSLVWGRGL